MKDKIKGEKEIAKIKKDLLTYEYKIKKELSELDYKNSMAVIKEKIRSSQLYHEAEKERMRIKNAEMRKYLLLKEQSQRKM